MSESVSESQDNSRFKEIFKDMYDLTSIFENESSILASGIHDVMKNILLDRDEIRKNMDDYLEKNSERIIEEDGKDKYLLNAEHVSGINTLKKSFLRQSAFAYQIPPMFLVALVMRYEAYIKSYLKLIYTIRPEALQIASKQISLAELEKFESISDAKNFILDLAIEDFFWGKSHIEQIEILEDKHNINFNFDEELFCKFVELSQRRNLFVHSDGIVNDVYLRKCSEKNVPLPDDCIKGDRLHVAPTYIEDAYETLLFVALAVTQTVHRKLLPDYAEYADDIFNNYIYELLLLGKYSLANKILVPVCKHPKSDETNRLYNLLNLAFTYKKLDDIKNMEKTIAKEDWSTKSDLYRLVVAVLEENWEQAADFMISIGFNSEVILEVEYREWPIFAQFRETDEFAAAFQEAFGIPFSIHECNTSDLSDEEAVDCLTKEESELEPKTQS